jgi:hypothetical protein
MALVVFRKCRRVTDPCLFPPYPIAQLLFCYGDDVVADAHSMIALDNRFGGAPPA